jgi:ABC-type multidrug transport system ATPase subunit
MTSGLAIETGRLTKRDGDVAAVDGFDLGVPVGPVVSLLGLNGAGKTTVVRMTAMLARLTSAPAAQVGTRKEQHT